MQTLTVVKVGGSLLRHGDDLSRVGDAIGERRRDGVPLLVVASALKGVTDLLEMATLRALEPGRSGARFERIIERLRHRHEKIAGQLTSDGTVLAQIQQPLAEVEQLLGTVRDSGELSERVYTRLLSSGERLSVPLLAATIRAAGYDARPITAEDMGLRAQGSRRQGVCDLVGSHEGFRKVRDDLRQSVIVLTGFYGIDQAGDVVLFGRGGSDDSACAVAAGLEAQRLELWKDVPGFMSADPKAVPSARVVKELSIDEVAKLGAYGSCIVHHGCLEPLRGRSTEVYICSLGGVDGGGTRLVVRREHRAARVAALTARKGRAELRISCAKGGARVLAARLLESLNAAKVPVRSMIASQQSLSFTVEDSKTNGAQKALELLTDHSVQVRHSPSLIGLVGDGVAIGTKISSRMLAYLSDSGIRSDSVVRRSGHAGLSCTVHREDLTPALVGLHGQFFAAA